MPLNKFIKRLANDKRHVTPLDVRIQKIHMLFRYHESPQAPGKRKPSREPGVFKESGRYRLVCRSVERRVKRS
ncbi:MAG: hypothetical protein ACRER2_10335, partial [Methylococcales bacterium]